MSFSKTTSYPSQQMLVCDRIPQNLIYAPMYKALTVSFSLCFVLVA